MLRLSNSFLFTCSSSPLLALPVQGILGTYTRLSSSRRQSTHKSHCSSSSSSSNKPLNEFLLTARTYEYLLDHTTEAQVLQQLREETATGWPNAKRMQVSPEQARHLAWLAGALGARSAIEVGVFTGYSALAVAQALPADGKLVACEKDERVLEIAQRYWTQAGVQHKVDVRLGPAAETLQQMLNSGQQGCFDFAFVDADKRGYQAYHEQLLQLLRRGGVVVYDNVLWYGQVADPQENSKATQALRSFSAFLLKDARVDFSMIPVGDGMALCRKL